MSVFRVKPGRGMNRKNTRKWRSVMVCLGVVVFLLSLGNADWTGAQAESAAPPAGAVAHLEYREVDFAPLATEISILPGARFRKEPVFTGHNVFLGFFCLGTDTNLFVPFVWDDEQRKLYVDANRNLDLTDDAPGGYLAADKSLELFRGVRLEFPSPVHGEFLLTRRWVVQKAHCNATAICN
jgi:hypothetical protein